MAFENQKSDHVEKSQTQNSAIESARPDIRDNDVVQVNEQLQGPENAAMLNSYMNNLATGDRNDLSKLLNSDNPFNQYKKQLESSVFGADGKVMASASSESIQKLQDVNNAMVAALTGRRTEATKQLTGAETMAKFNA